MCVDWGFVTGKYSADHKHKPFSLLEPDVLTNAITTILFIKKNKNKSKYLLKYSVGYVFVS